MMEIKFRAWDNRFKTMFSFVQLTSYKDDSLGIEVGSDFQDLHTLEDGEIMQYTGLKDKNGKDLYEGDCFIINRENLINGNSYSHKEVATYKTLEISKGDVLSKLIDFEIIGNIYENPELVK